MFKSPSRNKLPISHLIFKPSSNGLPSRNPRNTSVLLWFRSVRKSESDPNLSAKWTAYFLTAPSIRPFVLVVIIGLLFPSTEFVHAQRSNRQEVRRELSKIRDQMEGEEKKLGNIKKRQKKIKQSVQYLISETKRLKQEKNDLTEKVRGVELELDKLDAEVAAAKNRVDEQRQRFYKRIVSLYKMRQRAGALDYMVQAGSATDLLRRTKYLKRVAVHDGKAVNVLTEVINVYEDNRKKLVSKKNQHAKYLGKISEVQANLKRKKRKQDAKLDELKSEKESREKSLGKLKKSAAELEKVLASLMGGEPIVEPPPKVALPDLPKSKPAPEPPGPKVAEKEFEGKGLRRFRGKLLLPVDAKLLRRFGKQRHGEFVDVLFIKGLEFQGSPGTKVHAVAPGKVVFANVLPGYGNVVIVDHGKRYYTLYGRLASSLGRVGNIVKKEEMIGILGESDHKGRNFYFELRVKGKAVNPTGYFRDKPKMVGT